MDESEDGYDPFDDAEEEEYDCGQDGEGGCQYIGSEDCDECPYHEEVEG